MLVLDAALQNTCVGPDVIHCNLFFFRSNVNFALLLDVYILSGLFFPGLLVAHPSGSLSMCILRDAFRRESFEMTLLNASFELPCDVHLRGAVFVHPSRCLVMCIL